MYRVTILIFAGILIVSTWDKYFIVLIMLYNKVSATIIFYIMTSKFIFKKILLMLYIKTLFTLIENIFYKNNFIYFIFIVIKYEDNKKYSIYLMLNINIVR